MYRSPKGDTCLFVALEGADRLGKSTQGQLLEDALERAKVKAILDKSPYKDGATYGRIYEMLETGEAVRHPLVFQTLYGANRRFFQHLYLPTLAVHFDVVVMDRWSLSSRVYGGAAGVPEADTECLLSGLVEPDLTLVFDGEPFASTGEDDAYEADRGFQARVRASYHRWAQETVPGRVLVNANRGREAIRDEVLAAVLQRIPPGKTPMTTPQQKTRFR